MQTYTTFCRQADNIGTTWIGSVEAPNETRAADLAVEACAADWGWQDRTEEIRVVGVASGNVEILYWEDID